MVVYRGMSSSQAESNTDLQMDELGRKKLVAALMCSLHLNLNVFLTSGQHWVIYCEMAENCCTEMQINRLLYRSKQRGFLEMDLLLGLWAEDNIRSASPEMLKAFEVRSLGSCTVYSVKVKAV